MDNPVTLTPSEIAAIEAGDFSGLTRADLTIPEAREVAFTLYGYPGISEEMRRLGSKRDYDIEELKAAVMEKIRSSPAYVQEIDRSKPMVFEDNRLRYTMGMYLLPDVRWYIQISPYASKKVPADLIRHFQSQGSKAYLLMPTPIPTEIRLDLRRIPQKFDPKEWEELLREALALRDFQRYRRNSFSLEQREMGVYIEVDETTHLAINIGSWFIRGQLSTISFPEPNVILVS